MSRASVLHSRPLSDIPIGVIYWAGNSEMRIVSVYDWKSDSVMVWRGLTINPFLHEGSAMQPLVSVSVRQSIHVVRVYNRLSRLSLRQLEEARVVRRVIPDTSNPGGYSHLYVYFSYRSWFGLMRTVELYYERTAADNEEQESVARYAQHCVTTARGLASAKSFKWWAWMSDVKEKAAVVRQLLFVIGVSM